MLFKRKKSHRPNYLWIDQFIKNVREYIYVRPEDNLLIKRPNEVQRLNDSAIAILDALLKGISIEQLVIGMSDRQISDINLFFHALKTHLEGRNDQLQGHPGIEVKNFDMKNFEYPVLSELAITYKCNLKCNFCYAGINSSCSVHPDKEEMTFEEMTEVINKIFNQAKAPSISFTGGEPTLSPHLIPLVQYAYDLGMRVNLITNGTLITAAMAESLKKAGLSSAQVSIEGTCAEVHDHIVQHRGAFHRAIDGYFHLKRAGIHVHTNTTLSKDNIGNALDFPRFVKEELKSVRFSMNLLIPTGSAKDQLDRVVRYSEVGEVLEQMKVLSEYNGVEFMWYSPVPMCLYNTIANDLGNKGCSACDGLISVACNGDVLPCSSFSTSVGNIKTGEFESIWKSLESRKIRNKELAPEKCQSCEQLDLCHGSCPLYWEQMGTSELTGESK